MFDLKAIRENPEEFDKAMKRRKLEPQSPAILKLDEERRAIQTELQNLQAERNDKSKKVGEVKRTGGDADALMAEVAALKDRMTQLEEKERGVADDLTKALSVLPNILADDVPDGADEHGNVEVRKHDDAARPPVSGKNGAREHFEIGEALGMMDFEGAAKMSGARFVVLSGPLARLERALAQFMLDTHTQDHGYTEVSPPLMVRDEAMFGTGQLPKFAEDQFRTTRGDWLVPTSEVPLTNIVMDSIIDEDTLPRRYTAFTPCFRQEAGSAGKDTRGMIRMHQFYKVEMVSIVHPDKSDEEHQRMTACAETVLKKLGLSFRTMMLCTGDTGFGSRRTFDIEVWLPGQDGGSNGQKGRYREISSCSNCWDFQARRMNARFKGKGDKNTRFLHTLNGSGVATGRALIAVMENYYDPADGGIFIPDVLKPYMGGIEKIVKS